MNSDQWFLAIEVVILFHVAGFWIVLVWAFRLKRQVRCLHYCFTRMSDWGIDKLIEARDVYIEEHGPDNTPYPLVFVTYSWTKELQACLKLMKKAGVRISNYNTSHPIEDLSRLMSPDQA